MTKTNPALRFLLYSHDSFGLGHLRRALTMGLEVIARDTVRNTVRITVRNTAGNLKKVKGG